MTKEELLEKAKKDYPIGTVHAGSTGKGKFKVTSNDFIFAGDNIYSGKDSGCIYGLYSGWAKIISKPFVLPEKWCIRRTYENNIVINSYYNKHYSKCNEYGAGSGYMYSENILKDSSLTYHGYSDTNSKLLNKVDFKHENYIEITFEQFKQYVLKENIENMQRNHKKIISYKIKNKDYINAALSISQIPIGNTIEELCKYIKIGGAYRTNIEKAGVLDLWFEPIYEDEKIMIGDYEVIIQSKDVCKIEGNAYRRDELIALKALFAFHKNQIKSLNVGCNGQYKIDLDLINKIIDKMNNA